MTENIDARSIQNRQIDLKLTRFQNAIVIGVGGIGSWVALDLALSGCIKKMVLIDPDKIETSNLNRTPFKLIDVGYYKVDALKFLILERRTDIDIRNIQTKTNSELCSSLMSILHVDDKLRYASDPDNFIDNDTVIVDCRDDVFDDFYPFPCKYYKVGYDGFSVTIDGNPRNTAVWGRSNGYRHTPSFICPSQLAANLVVLDILSNSTTQCEDVHRMNIKDNSKFDFASRLNTAVTFDSRNILETLIQINDKERT